MEKIPDTNLFTEKKEKSSKPKDPPPFEGMEVRLYFYIIEN